jgi:hypothetical protein
MHRSMQKPKRRRARPGPSRTAERKPAKDNARVYAPLPARKQESPMYTEPFRNKYRLPAPPPPAPQPPPSFYLKQPYIHALRALAAGDAAAARHWLAVIATINKLGFMAGDDE